MSVVTALTDETGPGHAVLTPAEVAARWRVSPRTIRRLAARGHLPAEKIGGQWRITLTTPQEDRR